MADVAPSDDDDDAAGLEMFNEPDDFYEAEKQPTTATYKMLDGREISLRLVGHSPLWGHHLWQSSLLLTRYLESHAATLLANRSILELGAAAGLPSIIAHQQGASLVVATDYPDAELIDNLRGNLERNCAGSAKWEVEGYLWGAGVEGLNAYLREGEDGFDVLILADLLFNHSEHAKLVSTVKRTLRRPTPAPVADKASAFQPHALVFFTPYRPWLLDKDMAFFTLARDAGLAVEKMFEEKVERVMFENDRGDEELRRTVFGYRLTWETANEAEGMKGTEGREV